MQDIQSIGGGVVRLFGGGERRLKSHNHQAVKCPRCDSLNTKFCYYNNYNLSQPRFFCKGCRRYWTKGGVLRNVPVGGGCRKTKRSKQKSGNTVAAVAAASIRKPLDSHNSSSDSSPETTPFTLTEAAPVLDQCTTDNHNMFSEIGTFRSVMTSSSDQVSLGFNPVSEVSPLMQQQWVHATDNVKITEMDSLGFVDETGVLEFSGSCNGGVAAEDWGLFIQSFWSNNHDHQPNYFP